MCEKKEEQAFVDIKSTEDFTFKHYPEFPNFAPESRSLLSKVLTPPMFDLLKDRVTSKGYTLSNVIQAGVETPSYEIGATAGDEEVWEIFREIMYPIIYGWHKFDPVTQPHTTDLNASNLVFSDEQRVLFNTYVVSTRIRAARNISGFSLPCGTTAEDRAGVESLLIEIFGGFEGDLQGRYYPLGGMNPEDEKALQESGFLFQKPSGRNLLSVAGAVRDWPNNRGIFHNDSKTVLCWVNEEDHCRIISMGKGGDVVDVFQRFCNLSNGMEASARSKGAKLMYSERLGFLSTCPSNLGTALRASVMILIPQLAEHEPFLNKICSVYDLQPRGSSGELTAAIGGKYDISNKQRIGFSEVQLVQKMIDGVSKLIHFEQQLASGVPVADLEAQLNA